MAGFLTKSKQKLEHTAKLNVGEFKQLSNLLGTEKQLMATYTKLSQDTVKSALALRDWARVQDGYPPESANLGHAKKASLSDVTQSGEGISSSGVAAAAAAESAPGEYSDTIGRLADILADDLAASQNHFSDHYLKQYRDNFKIIRSQEEAFSSLRKDRDSLQSKIEALDKKLKKQSAEHKDRQTNELKLERMRQERFQLDQRVIDYSAELAANRKRIAREAVLCKLAALRQLGERMTIVDDLGKLIVAELAPDQGQIKSPLETHDLTREWREEARRCIKGVEGPAFPSFGKGSMSMGGGTMGSLSSYAGADFSRNDSVRYDTSGAVDQSYEYEQEASRLSHEHNSSTRSPLSASRSRMTSQQHAQSPDPEAGILQQYGLQPVSHTPVDRSVSYTGSNVSQGNTGTDLSHLASQQPTTSYLNRAVGSHGSPHLNNNYPLPTSAAPALATPVLADAEQGTFPHASQHVMSPSAGGIRHVVSSHPANHDGVIPEDDEPEYVDSTPHATASHLPDPDVASAAGQGHLHPENIAERAYGTSYEPQGEDLEGTGLYGNAAAAATSTHADLPLSTGHDASSGLPAINTSTTSQPFRQGVTASTAPATATTDQSRRGHAGSSTEADEQTPTSAHSQVTHADGLAQPSNTFVGGFSDPTPPSVRSHNAVSSSPIAAPAGPRALGKAAGSAAPPAIAVATAPEALKRSGNKRQSSSEFYSSVPASTTPVTPSFSRHLTDEPRNMSSDSLPLKSSKSRPSGVHGRKSLDKSTSAAPAGRQSSGSVSKGSKATESGAAGVSMSKNSKVSPSAKQTTYREHRTSLSKAEADYHRSSMAYLNEPIKMEPIMKAPPPLTQGLPLPSASHYFNAYANLGQKNSPTGDDTPSVAPSKATKRNDGQLGSKHGYDMKAVQAADDKALRQEPIPNANPSAVRNKDYSYALKADDPGSEYATASSTGGGIPTPNPYSLPLLSTSATPATSSGGKKLNAGAFRRGNGYAAAYPAGAPRAGVAEDGIISPAQRLRDEYRRASSANFRDVGPSAEYSSTMSGVAPPAEDAANQRMSILPTYSDNPEVTGPAASVGASGLPLPGSPEPHRYSTVDVPSDVVPSESNGDLAGTASSSTQPLNIHKNQDQTSPRQGESGFGGGSYVTRLA